MNLKNDRLLRALACQSVDKTPIWIMRQAGRYLPEYRQIRKRAGSFLALCKTPDLACEVTLQPIQRFDLDAAILFSDILILPTAMGMDLQFLEGGGPYFSNPVRCAKDIEKLIIPKPEEKLSYVTNAIRLVKHELGNRIPLIGFAGSPWTVACYMVEGSGKKDFFTIKKMMYREPILLKILLAKLAKSTSLYLKAQIDTGVDVIMLFDTCGGLLASAEYKDFSLHYMQNILEDIKQYAKNIPVIFFTKGGGNYLAAIANTGCDAIGLDWTIDISYARQQVPAHIALQGNLDPQALYAKPEKIKEMTHDILRKYGKQSGHIFNLGHGILPDIDPENVKVLVEAVHNGI